MWRCLGVGAFFCFLALRRCFFWAVLSAGVDGDAVMVSTGAGSSYVGAATVWRSISRLVIMTITMPIDHAARISVSDCLPRILEIVVYQDERY